MTRAMVDVELPAGACPRHQFCAYTGDEADRCPVCHAGLDDEGFCMGHESYPKGREAACLCGNCSELFTAISAFNKHFRPGYKCGNPAKRGLVLIEQNGWSLWGKPGSPPPRD